MDIYVDATTLIALGNVGELELLTNFDGQIAVLDSVFEEVTTEPARQRLGRICEGTHVQRSSDLDEHNPNIRRSKPILSDDSNAGDVQIIARVLFTTRNRKQPVAVVSDDRRVRTVAESLGATVTGTIGVVVRAVHEGMDTDEAKELVRRLDSQGLHMTGELREKAYRLVEEPAEKREDG
ncbi:Predicted nucleic acid-binding protein, contains PIN domain [Halopelagius inordinatus]|uniref:Predicted nucleic acid-binding protein, contains PIN domain n=1 Tax=Halopelagius inordinatus TaxID=553467 RepID=A0A1I2MI52_9EURY|nr:hypothetical protein [Halopelagius inordinatus]SFF90718.1 Predicted nucleic acid-binding protein, contains PIN domain [Halopelagius inordinatus]